MVKWVLQKPEFQLLFHDSKSSDVSWNSKSAISCIWPSSKLGWKEDPHPGDTFSLSLEVQGDDEKVLLSPDFKLFRSQMTALKESISFPWIHPRYHLLKSNCQKAMRLTLPSLGIKSTMLVFLTRDARLIQDLIKRWFIIVAEDGCVTKFALYFVFFWLAIEKGYKMTEF